MEEVYPDIFLIKEKGAYGAFKPPQNIYIIAGSDGLIIDAGYGDKKTVKYVVRQIRTLENKFREEKRDFNLKRLLITHAHPDHFSGAVKLRESLGIKIILSTLTAARLESRKIFFEKFAATRGQLMRRKRSLIGRIKGFFRETIGHFMFAKAFGLTLITNPDIIIPKNCDISINGENWVVFHSPGHASDHISLYNKKKGILFSGDNVLRTMTTWLGPPDSDLEDYIKSIEEISKLKNMKIIFGAHGSPITNPTERLAEILEHRKERLKQIENLIINSNGDGITPSEIVKQLYPGESVWKHSLARGYVILTIEYLEKFDKISRKVEKKGVIRFYPTNSK